MTGNKLGLSLIIFKHVRPIYATQPISTLQKKNDPLIYFIAFCPNFF